MIELLNISLDGYNIRNEGCTTILGIVHHPQGARRRKSGLKPKKEAQKDSIGQSRKAGVPIQDQVWALWHFTKRLKCRISSVRNFGTVSGNVMLA
jgi:hypothetical protein